jgi:hypothetical protein
VFLLHINCLVNVSSGSFKILVLVGRLLVVAIFCEKNGVLQKKISEAKLALNMHSE